MVAQKHRIAMATLKDRAKGKVKSEEERGERKFKKLSTENWEKKKKTFRLLVIISTETTTKPAGQLIRLTTFLSQTS